HRRPAPPIKRDVLELSLRQVLRTGTPCEKHRSRHAQHEALAHRVISLGRRASPEAIVAPPQCFARWLCCRAQASVRSVLALAPFCPWAAEQLACHPDRKD